MAAHRAALAGAAGAPVGDTPAWAAQAPGDGRDPARAAHWDAVERVGRDRRVQLEHRAPSLSGVGAGRGVRRDLAPGPCRVRPAGGDRLGVAGRRWGDDQGAAGRSKDRPESHRQSEKGAKRSVLSEGAGVPIGLAHDGANRNDHKLLKDTLDSIPIQRPAPTEDQPQGICLDKAYDNTEVADIVADYDLAPHIRTRGEEIQEKARTPGWRARRWVVEACHSWICLLYTSDAADEEDSVDLGGRRIIKKKKKKKKKEH